MNATIENVSDTAFWVAHYRSVETTRDDALFRDPLAGVLAGDRGKSIAEAMPRGFMTSWVIAIRTRIIDDFIRTAVDQGVDTVLNLGAGLDTRPYRMDLPSSLVWIEADYPHVIAYKEERLAGETPRFQLTRIKCDLADVGERRQLFATTNAHAKKLLVLTEGVVPYLNAEEVAALADDLRVLDHAVGWLVDFYTPELIKTRERMMGNRLKNAPFRFRPDDWFGFFEEHGWRTAEIRYLGEEADRLGRPVEMPLPVKLIVMLRTMFMSKARRERFQKAAGYAMLVPSAK
ncbi:SAM-dependent methyltransferase [Hyphomicrobium sp. 99]|uniref:class I SAM-dependent methyltransferase n=1 Tax=Hyphomicrobium sp. 99 TaxID=1163419 RepID=UPI001FD8DFA3|nr:SAM-dependent methyltransferase [Hyphomicrobium sp. 99]